MRHGYGYRKLGRPTDHRLAMLRNMVTSLIVHEKIKTTLPKAKELRRVFEKVITLAKRGDVHSRRIAATRVYTQEALQKAFAELAPRFKTRKGGYTRILKLNIRRGDGAQMAQIELTGDLDEKKETKEKKSIKNKIEKTKTEKKKN